MTSTEFYSTAKLLFKLFLKLKKKSAFCFFAHTVGPLPDSGREGGRALAFHFVGRLLRFLHQLRLQRGRLRLPLQVEMFTWLEKDGRSRIFRQNVPVVFFVDLGQNYLAGSDN